MSLPKLQTIANVTDFGALQADVLNVLLNTAALAQVNIVEERKLLLDASVNIDTVWQTPRAGGQGAGLIVEMIQSRVKSPNLPGPMFDLEISVVAIEERNLNFTPAVGTFLTSEQLAQIVHDSLHRLFIGPYGTLQGVGISAARDWFDEESGLNATRATLRMDNPRTQTARCAPIGFTLAGNEVTLTCATAGAKIYYTTDGSAPGPTGNPAATEYTEPFTVEAGMTLRAAGFLAGLNQSPIHNAAIT
jgi:hypothetical protein